MAVPVGLNVWSRLVEATFPHLHRTAAPFDSLWLPDHVQYAGHNVAEGWSLLAWTLARYPDKLCGHEVLCNSFRNPAHLAKMAATLQALSGGRLVLGIGAGWNEEEYRAYGWPFPPARVRIAQLAEAIELIRTMWTQAPAHYKGEHYRIEGAYCEPRPQPVPPIMVGGHGERYLLGGAAAHGDWWNDPFRGLETYGKKQEALKVHCRDVGRDYDEIQEVVRAYHVAGADDLLNLVVVPPHVAAVDLERLLLLRVRLEPPEGVVPPVAVCGRAAQQVALAVAAHHDRWDGLRPGLAVRALDPVVFALVMSGRLRPHRADQLDRFRQLGDADSRRRERPAVRPVLFLVPPGADAEDQTAAGERLEGRSHLREVRGIAKAVAEHLVAAELVGIPSQRPGQEAPALRDVMAGVLDMVRKPEGVEGRGGAVQVRKGRLHQTRPHVEPHGHSHRSLPLAGSVSG